MRKKKIGNIKVPKGSIIQPHELMVATILSWSGNDVEFIPVRNIPTPDIKFLGKEWEIKSPLGDSSRTIENNFRNALKQSSNIIIDLSRIKQTEEKCLREVKRQITLTKTVKEVIVILKSHKILKLK